MKSRLLLWALVATGGTALAAPQEALLYDGKMNPACVWDIHRGTNGVAAPIVVVTDFKTEREIGGVRIALLRVKAG